MPPESELLNTVALLQAMNQSLYAAIRIAHTSKLQHSELDNIVSDIKNAMETVRIAIVKTEFKIDSLSDAE